MRVAVFSDVQGNPTAFEAVVEDIVAWGPDLVVMNGDLVNRGPRSDVCLDLFSDLQRLHSWIGLRGNHEDFVLRCGLEPPSSDGAAEMRRFGDWAYRQLGDRVERLRDWPDHLCFHGPGDPQWVHVTHGSIRSNREGVSASVPDSELPPRLPEDAVVFVTAHTHKAMKRRFGGVEILNVGSVGTPFDGDVRASYGRLELRDGRWRTEIVRVDYDRDAANRDFLDSGFLDEGGPLARLIYEEWRRAELLIRFWNERYYDAVLSGTITANEAVDTFLAELRG